MWSDSCDEDAPPVTLEFDIPMGRYHVQAELYTASDFGGRPATALLVKAQEETEFRKIASDCEPGNSGTYVFVDVGDFEVIDGRFRVIVDEADDKHWACVTRFRFGPISYDARPESMKSVQERQEQLRALGYL